MLAETGGFSDQMLPLAVWRMTSAGGKFQHIVPLKNENNKIFITTLKNKKIPDRKNAWNKLEIYVWNWFMTLCSLEAWSKSVFGGSQRVGVETVWFSVTLILNEFLNWSVTLMTDWCVFGLLMSPGRCCCVHSFPGDSSLSLTHSCNHSESNLLSGLKSIRSIGICVNAFLNRPHNSNSDGTKWFNQHKHCIYHQHPFIQSSSPSCLSHPCQESKSILINNPDCHPLYDHNHHDQCVNVILIFVWNDTLLSILMWYI